ncbi:MAG: alpha/beta fold hydrolase [Phycisphaerae bacterium]
MTGSVAELGDLYPFESHYLDLHGHRMHYLDEGSGAAILMLHGNPTWSFYYRELVKGLRDEFRVIVPDHIGCGLSDKPRDYEYTLATHIANLERLLDHLGLDEAALALHDWGGAIGFGLCLRRPELARRFVVFNTAAFLGPCPRRIRLCGLPWVGELLVQRLNAFARCALHMACAKRERLTEAVKRGYLLPYDCPAHRLATLRFVRDIPLAPRVPSYQIVKRIEASLARFADRQVMLIWGAKDFLFNDWYLGEWVARFPEAAVHRFEDAGHYVVEDAHERIIPLMREFMHRQ